MNKKNIEDSIFENILPINSLAMINRFKELLEENKTNCLQSVKENHQIRKLMWLINQQVYGQLAIMNMDEEWQRLKAAEENPHKLIIKSLHDAQAECSCGRWYYSFTGLRTKAEIEEEFQKHS